MWQQHVFFLILMYIGEQHNAYLCNKKLFCFAQLHLFIQGHNYNESLVLEKK